MKTYLDVYELAERLGLKAETIVRNAKHAPWRLPPRAQLADRRMLRWAATEVELWLTIRRTAFREGLKLSNLAVGQPA